eukprot:SAG31_NODE_7341_length_1714_cov_4.182663_1_plen_140_part_10
MCVRVQVTELHEQTKTNNARLDECELETHLFHKEWRHAQDQDQALCRDLELATMLAACFVSSSEHVINNLSLEEQQGFVGLYADCNEAEQQGAMANMQVVEMKMFRINIDQEAEQQAAALANDGSRAPSPPFGPVVLPPS